VNQEQYKLIEEWNEDDLLNLPEEENDRYEYKSSKTPTDKLKDKICIAASAFWNSGGGFFFAGVDDHGQVDGGIPENIGRQKLRDWVDQVLLGVEPRGPYHIKLISKSLPASPIDSDKVVLVIGFGESYTAPHMAPDKKYYVRAGAHSGSTGHFLVEAIRAKRGIQAPMLRGILRLHERKSQIIELVIIPVNEATALNVSITFNPFPQIIERHFRDRFPVRIAAIDRAHPFVMDLSTFPGNRQAFGEDPVYLQFEYEDVLGRRYSDQQLLDPKQNMGPIKIGEEITEKVHQSLEKVARQLSRLEQTLRVQQRRLADEDQSEDQLTES
jgi:hypothetical protein